MSELVESKFGKLDLTIMEDVARNLGYTIHHNTVVRGNTNRTVTDSKCVLVLQKGHTEIGFQHKNSTETSCIYDNWTKAPVQAMREVMTNYTEQLTLRRAHIAGFKVLGRQSTDREIVIRLGRAR